MTRLRPHVQQAGFTLVEVLVALLVLAVMAGMAWQGVDGIVRARDASQTRLDQTLRINTVIAQWQQDLSALQDSVVLPQVLTCDGSTVRLTRRTPTGLQVVAWSLRPDSGGAMAWIRWAGPSVSTAVDLQDSWVKSLLLQGGEPGSLRVLGGLSQWQVYFFQRNGLANCQSTGDLAAAPAVLAATPSGASAAPAGASTSASTTPTTPLATAAPGRQTLLPIGVRLVLSFAPGSGVVGDLTRDVPLNP